MSDPNDKSASILLKKQGKTEAIFLYDFAQFTGQNEDAGLYRAKINGCWHCPDGKYTALSADAVAALVRDWLTGARASRATSARAGQARPRLRPLG